MNHRKLPFALTSLSAALLLSACVSDSLSLGSTTDSTSTISGTVPGTLIEAFCANGGHYKVNSVQDGSNQHPFSLALPNNISCTLVMTTNENDGANRVITPIKN